MKNYTLVRVCLFVGSLATTWAVTPDQQIVLIRHGEKPADPNNNDLSPAGYFRAKCQYLHRVFVYFTLSLCRQPVNFCAKSFIRHCPVLCLCSFQHHGDICPAPVSRVLTWFVPFHPRPHEIHARLIHACIHFNRGPSHREEETAQPLATLLNLRLQTPYCKNQYADLAQEMLALPNAMIFVGTSMKYRIYSYSVLLKQAWFSCMQPGSTKWCMILPFLWVSPPIKPLCTINMPDYRSIVHLFFCSGMNDFFFQFFMNL